MSFIKKEVINATIFYGVDSFGNLYYSTNNVLFKKTATKTYQYTNLALGSIGSVSIYNPLELVVFYKDFNSVIILDNTLNEIQKIAFLDKNISLVAKASKNELWLFNTDTQLLELYNYKAKTVVAQSQPRSLLDPKKLQGNANNVWIKTKDNYLKQFNIYGTEVESINKKIDAFSISKSGWIVFESNNELFLKSNVSSKINLNQNLNIKCITIVDNKLYIFDGKAIFMFMILKN
jgi:hypothetical protein